MSFKINVLLALTGFRKAAGASDADAAAWANANLAQGEELVKVAFATNRDERAKGAAFTALKALAAG